MKEHLSHEEPKTQMLEETRQALTDIKAGRVVDVEKVMNWLESWGTNIDRYNPLD